MSDEGNSLEFTPLSKGWTGKSIGPSKLKTAKTAKTAKCPTLAVLTGVTVRHWQSQRVTTGPVPGQDRQDRQAAKGTPLAL